MKTFYISDLHFGHRNALAFDNREFNNIEEHDETIIRNWNSVVGIDDEVWVLGDVSWYGATKTIEIFNRLKGIKKLCIGNHDKKLLRNKDFRALFSEITDYKEIEFGNRLGVVLSHWPITCYNKHYYGWYHLYGHVHTGFEWNIMKQNQYQMRALYDKPSHMYNVGCMVPGMDFTPRTLEEILDIFENEGDGCDGNEQSAEA